MLTHQRILELLEYRDGKLYWKIDHGRKIKHGQRAGRLGGQYWQLTIDYQRYYEHRLVWFIHYGRWPTDRIDHINGNKLDNRIENLRECSQAENTQNRSLDKRNTSGYMGVSKQGTKWLAQIMSGGKHYRIGLFDTPELAHDAYLQKKAELHTFNPVPRK